VERVLDIILADPHVGRHPLFRTGNGRQFFPPEDTVKVWMQIDLIDYAPSNILRARFNISFLSDLSCSKSIQLLSIRH
jgi:hypothetical protein